MGWPIYRRMQACPYILVDDKAEAEPREEEPPADQEGGVLVYGNIISFVERLDDEMFKILQVTDPHTNEYLKILKDEPIYLALASMSTEYVRRTGDMAAMSRLSLRRMEHLYYKVIRCPLFYIH